MKDSRELLRDTLQEWGALHGRKIDERAIEVWMRIFVNTNTRVLALALQTVTEECERMPTPGMLTKALAHARERLQIGDAPKLTYIDGKDSSGVPCIFWSDEPYTSPAYRAKDCAEGREFLKTLARVAGIII
jgi:hypothetical protein